MEKPEGRFVWSEVEPRGVPGPVRVVGAVAVYKWWVPLVLILCLPLDRWRSGSDVCFVALSPAAVSNVLPCALLS